MMGATMEFGSVALLLDLDHTSVAAPRSRLVVNLKMDMMWVANFLELSVYLGYNQLFLLHRYINKVILWCDNLNGQTTTKCSYEQTIGTSFSESASEGMSVSESVKDAIHAGLFDIFSNNLEISTTTGYDWTHASENTKSEQTTVKIEAEAPPGGFIM